MSQRRNLSRGDLIARRFAGAPGVSLLEALVALAIIGIAFSVVLQLQAQLTRNVIALQRAAAETAWRHNLVAIAASARVRAAREGLMAVDNATISWTTSNTPVAQRDNRRQARDRGPWSVSLEESVFRVTAGPDTYEATRKVLRAAPRVEAFPQTTP